MRGFISLGNYNHVDNNHKDILGYVYYGSIVNITRTCLFKYTVNFTTKKWKFSDEKF